MKNRKSFLKGALCGALAMLLVAGLVSCGLKVNNGNSDITSKTEDKISELQNLIEKHYMGDAKEKNLEDGVYKGYINGLNDPYSAYYNKKETKELTRFQKILDVSFAKMNSRLVMSVMNNGQSDIYMYHL